MKKLLLFSSLFLSVFTGFSQIVLEETDFPQPGDYFYQGVDTMVPLSITPGSAGADQTWDFSQLRTREGDTLNFEDPATLPAGSSFPNSFLAVEQFGGWAFAESYNSKVEIVGFSGDFSGLGVNMDIHFQDPQTIIIFPANYLDTYTDTSIIDVKVLAPPGLIPFPGVDSIHFKRFTDISSEIDGYGNVVTPLQTYAALRQRNVENNVDSIWVRAFGSWFLAPGQAGFENPSISTTHRYNYIIKEIGYYAVSLNSNENDSIIRATFLSDPSLCCFGAGVEETDIKDAFSIYPNPADNEFTIRTDNLSQLVYSVVDITGKQVLCGNINSNLTIVNTSTLADGLYVCRVFSADGKLTGSNKISISGN